MIVVGLSHHTAPVELRERLALDDQGKNVFLGRVCEMEGVDEAFVLGTCNRVEVYAVAGSGHHEGDVVVAIRKMIADHAGVGVAGHLVSFIGDEAVEHLFRVASSLESLVVGEPQILGQLKGAVQHAEQQGVLGPTLRELTNRAFQCAKRVRTETQIGAGQASVPTAAVRLARQIFGELQGRTAMLVGAGEMAQSAAKVLVQAGANLVIVNRSRDRAERLQRHVGGEIVSWDQLEATLSRVDIVLSSTACPAVILTRELMARVRRARRGKSLFLIDIAVPRDVDPKVNDLDGMYVHDIDDLSRIVEASREAREKAARLAAGIVEAECAAFAESQRVLDVTPIIKQLRERTQRVLNAELERSLNGKLRDLTPRERGALQAMVNSATNKLLHEPTMRLRAMAGAPDGMVQAQCLCALFDLGPDASPRTKVANALPNGDGSIADASSERNTRGAQEEKDVGWFPLTCELAR